MVSLTDNPLVKGEKVVYRLKLHPIIYWATLKAIFWTSFLFMLPYILQNRIPDALSTPLANNMKWIVFAGLGVTGYTLIKDIIKQQFTEIVITDQRLSIKTGLFSTNQSDMSLKQIESTSISRTFPARMLNYGTVVISGIGGQSIHIRFVKDPNEFTWFLNAAKQHADDKTPFDPKEETQFF